VKAIDINIANDRLEVYYSVPGLLRVSQNECSSPIAVAPRITPVTQLLKLGRSLFGFISRTG